MFAIIFKQNFDDMTTSGGRYQQLFSNTILNDFTTSIKGIDLGSIPYLLQCGSPVQQEVIMKSSLQLEINKATVSTGSVFCQSSIVQILYLQVVALL